MIFKYCHNGIALIIWQNFDTFIRHSLQEELEQNGHYELDYEDIINNSPLLEAVPEIPSLVKDRSEMFLNAAGVAFVKVYL